MLLLMIFIKGARCSLFGKHEIKRLADVYGIKDHYPSNSGLVREPFINK